MKVPYQFAGNEEMYKLAVRLYLEDLMGRALLRQSSGVRITSAIITEMSDDMLAIGQELMAGEVEIQ